MDFIVENYAWFLVGFIICLMTFIGYLADKTDFGRKKMTNKNSDTKPKKEKLEEKPQKIKVDAIGINDLSNDINDIKPNKEDISEKTEEIDKALFEPLDSKTEEKTQKKEESNKKEEKNVSEEEDIWKF